jgi:Ca2+-binding RTX toxin-like protein
VGPHAAFQEKFSEISARSHDARPARTYLRLTQQAALETGGRTREVRAGEAGLVAAATQFRWNGRSVMNYRFAGALVVLFMVAAMPAMGGTVSISGDAIVFEAGSDEVNTLVIDGRGGVFDPSGGPTILGVTISDSTANLFAQAPCRVVLGTAVCEVTGIFRAVIRLGNRNDRVSHFDGDVLQMNVDGGLGDDTIIGGPLADTLDGGAGADTIDGGDGDDRITGGLGDDTLNGGRGKDGLFGNAGKDVVNGDGDNDEIDGGIGDDVINGGQGSDVIRGDTGADRIASQDGFVDNINCGIGKDSLTRDGNDSVKRCE